MADVQSGVRAGGAVVTRLARIFHLAARLALASGRPMRDHVAEARAIVLADEGAAS